MVMSTVHDQTHSLKFTDGPLEGHVYTLTGVVPFAMFQIGGDMDTPNFAYYVLDTGQSVPANPDAMPVYYKFVRTYTFEEFATLLPAQPDPPAKPGS